MTTVPHRPALAPGRLLAIVALLLAVAAAVLWGSSRIPWVSRVVETVTGPRATTADGATAEPVLVPWALLCLAAIGGLVATSGWGRRVVGTLVAVAGLWAVLRAASGFLAPAAEALPVAARAGERPLPTEAVAGGPSLGLLGALLMLAAGLLTVRWAAVLPRMGARYDAPGGRGDAVRAGPARPADPDKALWEALDEGRDPTREPDTHPPDGPRAGPSDGVGSAGGGAG